MLRRLWSRLYAVEHSVHPRGSQRSLSPCCIVICFTGGLVKPGQACETDLVGWIEVA
jgi:hypothetical protein